MLTNVLILKRFVNNTLNRFIHLGKKGDKEVTSFPTLSREGWTTSSSFPKKG